MFVLGGGFVCRSRNSAGVVWLKEKRKEGPGWVTVHIRTVGYIQTEEEVTPSSGCTRCSERHREKARTRCSTMVDVSSERISLELIK